MPHFASDDDRTLQRAIESWKQTAADEVGDIGGWRDDVDERNRHVGDPARYWSAEPNGFYSASAYLSGVIVAQFPKLDPTPIQEVCHAVAAWYADRNASRIPSQPVLFSTLERSMMTLQSIEGVLRSRMIRDDGPLHKVDAFAVAENASTLPTKLRSIAAADDPSALRFAWNDARQTLRLILEQVGNGKAENIVAANLKDSSTVALQALVVHVRETWKSTPGLKAAEPQPFAADHVRRKANAIEAAANDTRAAEAAQVTTTPIVAPTATAQAVNSADGLQTAEERALALLVAHPDWTDVRIAETVGVTRTTVYKWDRYKQARRAMRSTASLPKGTKDGETGSVEAYDDE